MTACSRRQPRHPTSIRPKRDFLDRLARELERSKVPPGVVKQATKIIALLLVRRSANEGGNDA